jgi:hypothetical protein
LALATIRALAPDIAAADPGFAKGRGDRAGASAQPGTATPAINPAKIQRLEYMHRPQNTYAEPIQTAKARPDPMGAAWLRW